MKYFDDFTDKFGFGDGESLPPDADAYREVLIRTFNRRAEAVRAKVRCIAFNRPGMHNTNMVLFVRATALMAIQTEHLHDPEAMSQWVSETDNFTAINVLPTHQWVASIMDWLNQNLELNAAVRTVVTIDSEQLARALKWAGQQKGIQ